ncbi:hypothetical protein GCM10009836_06370 [Pseudonocardia ailaonensis]|uniref:NTP pyrophosphohydrolase n=1 Tax=Pseudonocardia ailaonensis TaxID=367279 RepID=A0ABN2MLR0_9PSEU
MLLVIDGANVVGSRPDGWWRDRAGAASRLAAQLAAARSRGALDDLCAAHGPVSDAAAVRPGGDGVRVVLVLEGAAKRAAIPDGLEVRLAPRDGDSAMVELAHEAGERDEDVVVVTADRELTRLLHAVGARTIRPGTLLARL